MPPSDLAAQRGEPSYLWRAGQERRLQMIARWATLDQAYVLEAACGIGMYTAQIRQRYTPHVEAFDIEPQRARSAQPGTPHAIVAAAEHLPYPANTFDTVISNEVLEHVNDDQRSVDEMIRVTKPGGHIVIFTPNRWYPFETHGFYWRGQYHFGNTPLINYLPDVLRNRLAPHVRAYTERGLRRLLAGRPVQIVNHQRIYGGYDNITARFGTPGRWMRDALHKLEGSPLDFFGLSHLLVIEKRS